MIRRRNDPGKGIELPVGEADPPGMPGAPGAPGTQSKRKRVVLADARAPVTVLRRISEIEEQTSVGEQKVRDLVSPQLRAACLLLGLVAVLLGAIPLAAYLSPGFAALTVFGVRLSWILIGVLPFPLLFGIGYASHRFTERSERDFVRDVERDLDAQP